MSGSGIEPRRRHFYASPNCDWGHLARSTAPSVKWSIKVEAIPAGRAMFFSGSPQLKWYFNGEKKTSPPRGEVFLGKINFKFVVLFVMLAWHLVPGCSTSPLAINRKHEVNFRALPARVQHVVANVNLRYSSSRWWFRLLPAQMGGSKWDERNINRIVLHCRSVLHCTTEENLCASCLVVHR